MGFHRATPLQSSWTRFFIVLAVLTVFMVIVLVLRISTMSPNPYYSGWQRPVPSAAISACAAEMLSSDPRVRIHGRDTLTAIALECPAVAELLTTSIAELLDDDDLHVRATTVESLGRLGPPARRFAPAIESLRGSSVPTLDHTIDIALAGLRREETPPENRQIYCSSLTRDAVQGALQVTVAATWPSDAQSLYDGPCRPFARREE